LPSKSNSYLNRIQAVEIELKRIKIGFEENELEIFSGKEISFDRKRDTMKIYFEEFNSQEDVFREFAVSAEQSKDIEILYAWYGYGSYDGQAHVIFRKDDKVYEVNGSHCSCYGLEGQWEPEETSVIALLARPNVAEDAKAILRSL
jgi:hypothetical protein